MSSASAWATLRLFSASSLAWLEMKPLLRRSMARSYLVFDSVRLARARVEVGLLHRVVEPHQHVALGDALAFPEEDLRDAAGDLGAQDDGLVGAQAAHGGERLRQLRTATRGGLDGDAGRRRPPLARRGGGAGRRARRARCGCPPSRRAPTGEQGGDAGDAGRVFMACRKPAIMGACSGGLTSGARMPERVMTPQRAGS